MRRERRLDRGRRTRLGLLLLTLAGMNRKTIAGLVGMSAKSLDYHWSRLKALTGRETIGELAQMAATLPQGEWFKK